MNKLNGRRPRCQALVYLQAAVLEKRGRDGERERERGVASMSACHGGDEPGRVREDIGGNGEGRCCLSNKEMLMQ